MKKIYLSILLLSLSLTFRAQDKKDNNTGNLKSGYAVPADKNDSLALVAGNTATTGSLLIRWYMNGTALSWVRMGMSAK